MRAVRVQDGAGNADALYIDNNVQEPQAVDNRILVRVKAFGLNRMDTMQREGRYNRPEWGDILGVEFSGIVEKLGPDCSADFKIGDQVFSLAYGGAYAEKICVSEKMLMHMPSNLTFEEAAGAPETIFTALQAIHLVGAMQPGANVLIHAGASGVGMSAIQLAKVGGASKVFATAGSDEKTEMCRSVGADFAINYRTTDFAKVVEEAVGANGVDLIVDMVGRDYWDRNVRLAAMDSRIVVVATLSGSVIEGFDLRDLMSKRIYIMTTTLRTRSAAYQIQLRDYFVEKVMPHLSTGKVKTIVDAVYPWTRVAEAHKRMESNINSGKIICTID
jgi:putative PIG3 family NAD(P)H quinone oxidoreductase